MAIIGKEPTQIPVNMETKQELTDEEIYEIYAKVCENTQGKQVIDFARAILRKAQEK